MSLAHIRRRLTTQRRIADQMATDLIIDCELAVSGRNGRCADPADWNATDWRRYLYAAKHSPATLVLPALYAKIGQIETSLIRVYPARSFTPCPR